MQPDKPWTWKPIRPAGQMDTLAPSSRCISLAGRKPPHDLHTKHTTHICRVRAGSMAILDLLFAGGAYVCNKLVQHPGNGASRISYYGHAGQKLASAVNGVVTAGKAGGFTVAQICVIW